jgi:hypothetical protein
MISELTATKRALVAQFPELEYHFEPERAPTEFMRHVQELSEEAEKAAANGLQATAIAKLQEALSLEPPSLVYEFLEKRRDELLKNAQPIAAGDA